MFLALTINNIDRLNLIRTFINPTSAGKVWVQHVTIAFQPDMDTILEFAPKMNQFFQIEVLGFVKDEKASALIVRLFDIQSKNKFPHITLQTAEGIPPKYSNELIATAETINWEVDHLTFKGKLELFP